jgi:hypothetical protein
MKELHSVQQWALRRLLVGHPPCPGLDWMTVLDLARRHGVSPLLYWKLEKSGGLGEHVGGGQAAVPSVVPTEAREELEKDYYTAAARSMLAERQLAEVLKMLAEAGVPTLVIRGAAIGAFYPDPALRPYGEKCTGVWSMREWPAGFQPQMCGLGRFPGQSVFSRPGAWR